MKGQRWAMILLLSVWIVGPLGMAQANAQAASTGYHEFTITAKSHEFDPSVITVKKGEKVRLLITAADRDHGFKLEGYDIDQVLKQGHTETIEFTADKAGTFTFKCSVYCGRGHGKMKGKLIVEE